MKKTNFALTFVIALLITGNGNCLIAEAAKKPVSLSKKNITLNVGQIKNFNVKKAAKVKIKSKTFTSSDKKVVSVTKKAGKIKAKKAGRATITVKVKYVRKPDKKTKTTTLKCKVNVVAGNIKKSGGASTPKPTNTTSAAPNSPAEKNSEEVTALRKLIAEQKALGATVSEDLNNWQYTWDKEGHLVSIDWDGYGLRGNINFDGFPYLTKLNCGWVSTFEGYITNQLTGLEVSRNEKLAELYCRDNQLTNLDVGKNINLEYLYCQENQLVSLNIGNNSNLYLFWDGNIFSAPVANYSNAK